MLYRHFASMEDIAEAVALEGFGELTVSLAAARQGAPSPEDALDRVARAYCTFASENPALYDVMFTRCTQLRFAAADSPELVAAAFAELRTASSPLPEARRRHPDRGYVGCTARIGHPRTQPTAEPRS